MTPEYVVVPTRGADPTRLTRVAALAGFGVPMVVVTTDLAHTQGVRAVVSPYPHVTVVHSPRFPINIHRWWNTGLDTAVRLGARVCAVVNDDITATRDDLIALASAAVGGISYTVPPWQERETPMTGYAFGIDPHAIRPDEGYRWWWGEHCLYRDAVDLGLTVTAVSTRITHARVGMDYPDLPPDLLHGMIDADRVRWTQRTPRTSRSPLVD